MIKKTKNKNTSSQSLATNKPSNASDNALISVLEKLPIGVVVFKLNKILFLNKIAFKIFKPSKELKKTIYNRSIFEFLLPEYHKRIKENNIKILNGEEFVPFELKIRNAKNEIIDLEVKSNAIIFNGEKAIQTIFTDISEQVKFRDELFEAKQNLEQITQNANDLIFFYTYHPKPKYIYISPSIKKILGYTPQDFYRDGNLGSKIVVDKKGYKKFEAIVRKKQKNNTLKHTSTSFEYKTKSGKLVWLEDNYSPIYDESGKIKFVLGISRDITKEKTAQLDLEQRWSGYKNLLDTLPVGVFIHNQGSCIYANKTAAKILEYSTPKKLEGLYLVNFIAPELREVGLDRIKRAAQGEKLTELEYDIITSKNKRITVELRTVPIFYNGINCVQTIITDVSQEKKLQREKFRAEVAEESNKKLKEEINYQPAL